MTANQPERDTGPDAPTPGRRPADTYANRLLLTRALAGHISIREAADITGLNREAWRDWERGRRPRDILDACRRIADALDIDHDWLLFGGPLAGPRGMPVKGTQRTAEGPGGLNMRYPTAAVRPTPGRPNSRPTTDRRPGVPPSPGQRRPVRISGPSAA